MVRQNLCAREAAQFSRPKAGPTFRLDDFPSTGLPCWQSHGGALRGHPARSLPKLLEVDAPRCAGALSAVRLLGVFALYAEPAVEASGTCGAVLTLESGARATRLQLLNGIHYRDARDLEPWDRDSGDGIHIATVGVVEHEGERLRVDLLTLDAGPADRLRFRDLATPASFCIFDVYFEFEPAHECPFHSRGGGVPLGEIGALLRLGDRPRFNLALNQLAESLHRTSDLDEARGQALTFLAVTTSALLEHGGARQLHREQLEAARQFDRLENAREIAEAVRERVERVVAPMFREPQGPSAHLVERALALIDRNYARSLSDALIAEQLGLSTSHFRFLFKEATGQPFHRYLIALRLEKAKQLLLERELPISVVARAVGFAGLSHFSRAFTQRFGVSPTNLRRGAA